MINNIGIQLNAFENECRVDLDATLFKLSQLGFKAVEFCDFFGKRPEEINALLLKHDLKLAGTHVKMHNMLDT